MKTTTKLSIKLFLIISLFVSVGFADDGHMPSGGFTTPTPTPAVCSEEGHMPSGGIVPCPETGEDGHMPSGGRAASANDPEAEKSFLDFVRNYLYSLFG